MIVADSNLLVYLAVKDSDEFTPLAEKAYRLDPEWHAPALWRSEFMNVLTTLIRARRVPLATALQVMNETVRVMERREHVGDHANVLELAAATGASAYDCEFVALAQRLDVKLVTNDGPLLKLFPHDTLSLRAFTV